MWKEFALALILTVSLGLAALDAVRRNGVPAVAGNGGRNAPAETAENAAGNDGGMERPVMAAGGEKSAMSDGGKEKSPMSDGPTERPATDGGTDSPVASNVAMDWPVPGNGTADSPFQSDGTAERPVAERPLEGFAGTASPPPGSWLVREGDTVVSPECPSKPFAFEAIYPQGLDGGRQADRAVQALTSALLADSREAGERLAKSGRLCGGPGPPKILHTGRGYRSSPSPDAVASAFFITEYYPGGGRGSVRYLSLNLLDDGSELTADRLFEDPDAGLSRLWRRVFRDFCARGFSGAPAFYGAPACGIQAPRRPGRARADGNLDPLGHGLLTSLGLTLPLDPGEAWDWNAGPVWLDIPKEDLVLMGADPAIWR
ncbi:MAG: hypothetical protein LBR80_17270 [Deltaproteobacteria bacterium]|jgi:hypothetical protein|nr:hypothetical protein [Deltaproteobacteria bacterium]